MSNKKSKIAVLLPTRGRTQALERSVKSLVELASNKQDFQIVFGFDDDDTKGPEYFLEKIQPWLDQAGVEYTALSFAPMSYSGLNTYYNSMAQGISTDWFFVWNDDAIMETSGWDKVIQQYTGQFKLLKVHTHAEHPYSIFPIVPAKWFELLGYFSRHQMIDAELSQNAYVLDIMEIVDITVTHDRADLTGNNQDETHAVRVRFEGNPADPRDFHNKKMFDQRLLDTNIIYEYLKGLKTDLSWYESVLAGKQDPWIKLRANDVNKQMTILSMV
jgi:hypothetical protein